MKYLMPLLLLLPVLLNAQSSNTTSFQNNIKDSGIVYPVIPGDFADPSVIRVGNTYYASGTSSEWGPHYALFTSKDLIRWQQSGYILPQTPSWALSSFWAPELYYRNGTFYTYYVARKKADKISCIGVATTKDPANGFTDHGIIVDFGKEAIDPFINEVEGKLYITFKAYGLDQRPIELLGYQLSDDGLKTIGEPFSLLRDDDRKGLEGQCIVQRNGYYYLLYSAGDCCGSKCSYYVDVARSTSFRGPYTKFENNPVLAGYGDWKCTGHGTIVQKPNGEDFFLYHAYSKEHDVFTGRQAMLGKVSWNAATGWPSIQTVSGEKPTNFKDDFSTTKLNNNWQWDYRHTEPTIKIEKGMLYLSGKVTSDNKTGTALTVRPYESDYEISTAVINKNASLKGLTVYGDANQAAAITIKNDTIQVWYVKGDERNIIKETTLKNAAKAYLKIKVENGDQLHFYYHDTNDEWIELSGGNGFEVPWDRSLRPGLIQSGKAPAAFDFFEIKY
ncbi:family 43 glycosylhydrolase [soil metagenome]